MFENFGFFEGVVIVILAFLLLGPEKLPQLFEWLRKIRLWRIRAQAEFEQAVSQITEQKIEQEEKTNRNENNGSKHD